jgi:hypothetical protein
MQAADILGVGSLWALWKYYSQRMGTDLGLHISRRLAHLPWITQGDVCSRRWGQELSHTLSHFIMACWGWSLVKPEWVGTPTTIWTDRSVGPPISNYMRQQLSLSVLTFLMCMDGSQGFPMVMHHMVAMLLVAGCIATDQLRTGLVLLVMHNTTDVLAGFTKLTHQLKLHGRRSWFMAEICFTVNLLAWGWVRTYLFTLKFLPAYWTLCPHNQPLLTTGLVLLAAMHARWLVMFMRIAVKLVRGMDVTQLKEH